jgi:hypothetical protein
MKEINTEWMSALSKFDKQTAPQKQENTSNIEWLNVNKAYKKKLTFKVMPANSKENKAFAWVVGTHWNLGSENMRFVCPEQTLHLRHNEVICPICEAKRKLLSMGFTEEQLSKEGKFGPISVFDPKITSNVKVVALDSDMQQFDRKHISILQQNGSYTARWLAEKYQSPEWPDFLELARSNPIKFARERDNGKWERELVFNQIEFDGETLEKLAKENEELTMTDLWKMPSDEEILKAKEIADKLVKSYLEARDAANTAATSSYEDDEIPF